MAKIQFTISWKEKVRAQLLYLVIDEETVVKPADALTGQGKIEVPAFESDATGVHDFEWSLWFNGKTLTNLTAAATIDEVGPQTIEKSKSEDSRWADEGTL